MSEKKHHREKAPHPHQAKAAPHVKAPVPQLFTKENYTWMIGGIVIIAIGMFLMSGGKNPANQFDQKLVYSTTRITIAPFLICLGLGVEIVALFKKPKA